MPRARRRGAGEPGERPTKASTPPSTGGPQLTGLVLGSWTRLAPENRRAPSGSNTWPALGVVNPAWNVQGARVVEHLLTPVRPQPATAWRAQDTRTCGESRLRGERWIYGRRRGQARAARGQRSVAERRP